MVLQPEHTGLETRVHNKSDGNLLQEKLESLRLDLLWMENIPTPLGTAQLLALPAASSVCSSRGYHPSAELFN